MVLTVAHSEEAFFFRNFCGLRKTRDQRGDFTLTAFVSEIDNFVCFGENYYVTLHVFILLIGKNVNEKKRTLLFQVCVSPDYCRNLTNVTIIKRKKQSMLPLADALIAIIFRNQNMYGISIITCSTFVSMPRRCSPNSGRVLIIIFCIENRIRSQPISRYNFWWFFHRILSIHFQAAITHSFICIATWTHNSIVFDWRCYFSIERLREIHLMRFMRPWIERVE